MDRLERSERAPGEYAEALSEGEARAARPACDLQEWRLLGRPAGLALRLRGDDDTDSDLDALVAASRITVEFPAFTDGRGFSLGRRLRQRGFAGPLIAAGELLPDQWSLLQRCGFSALESAQLSQRTGSCVSPAESYQGDALHAGPLFRRRAAPNQP